MAVVNDPVSPAEPDSTPDQIRSERDLDWLRTVLGRGVSDRRGAYLARPSGDDLHLLVPTEPSAAAAAALRRFDDNRSPAKIIAGLAGRALARTRLLALAPGERLELEPFALVEHLATTLGEPELLAAVTLGPPRRNRKPVLQLIRPDGVVVGFAKVGWSPLTNALVANEADLLTTLEGRLPPPLLAPRVLHHGPWGDGTVVVTTPLQPAGPLSTLLPRRSAPLDTVEIVRAIAAVDDRGSIPVDRLDLLAEWRDHGLAESIDLDRVIARHGATELRVGLWHGDFTPWNLLADGDTLAIWDWEFGGRGRPVGFDALHHDFERLRRAADGSNHRALTITVERSAGILNSIGVGASKAERDAIVDLYLCELIVRELRLHGQRWGGGAIARLAPVAIDLLGRRLHRADRP